MSELLLAEGTGVFSSKTEKKDTESGWKKSVGEGDITPSEKGLKWRFSGHPRKLPELTQKE